ncbi:Crp/Fnr family transcriptional regulator [Hymenobacter cellulosilyticus]|uniref:Crp/Fnr family transcriptional regulator n=1 Tax=Hymenobacter cellulosilyticus TaxID=2932248 RepID=A0A8T9QG03_9BACT|nr:Crp/Fnr family transcriptional regulator [Hymenobacter cellulosilyticus]UOQ75088.1 Crp/Fnr family transcriptional regulator [Hymenobacter cellulosilyticus]
MENLRKAFGFGGVLHADEITQVTDPFRAQSLRAGEHFFAPGDSPNQLGFVSAGVCRLYLVGREPEQEATRCFIRPHQFILDLESFHSNRPSQVGIQALTACELLVLDKRTWQQLLVEVPKLFILSKLLTEVALLNNLKDSDFLLFGTARQKYEEFVKRYPDLALCVPQHYIASYLGITPSR